MLILIVKDRLEFKSEQRIAITMDQLRQQMCIFVLTLCFKSHKVVIKLAFIVHITPLPQNYTTKKGSAVLSTRKVISFYNVYTLM